ncbi:MAG TPA: hypothetical protein VJ020_08650 [Anaerolineales bacterium]|nr:hypothetical protein [Anaerolineales bacterium]
MNAVAVVTNMLESLDTIDWTSVRHAYGVASDIPPLLRALLSTQQVERQKALEALDNLIHHQGTLYEAAVYVAPFLVEMLEAYETPDKENIAIILALLAEDKSPEDYSEKEFRWAQSLRAIIERNIHILYSYLEAKEAAVRWVMAYTLALFPRHSATSLPLLERAFTVEEQPNIKEGIGKAIMKLKSQSTNNTS